VPQAPGGEGMIFHFTDGSRLKLVIGSNASNIGVADNSTRTSWCSFGRPDRND
jgi:hypothetical protein